MYCGDNNGYSPMPCAHLLHTGPHFQCNALQDRLNRIRSYSYNGWVRSTLAHPVTATQCSCHSTACALHIMFDVCTLKHAAGLPRARRDLRSAVGVALLCLGVHGVPGSSDRQRMVRVALKRVVCYIPEKGLALCVCRRLNQAIRVCTGCVWCGVVWGVVKGAKGATVRGRRRHHRQGRKRGGGVAMIVRLSTVH